MAAVLLLDLLVLRGQPIFRSGDRGGFSNADFAAEAMSPRSTSNQSSFSGNAHVVLTLSGARARRRAVSDLSWKSSELAKSNVRRLIQRRRPDLVKLYDQFASCSPAEIKELRNAFYKLRPMQMRAWGLENIFRGSVFTDWIQALQETFDALQLNRLGFFPKKGASGELLEETMRFVIGEDDPQLLADYLELKDSPPSERLNDLCRRFYVYQMKHMYALGLEWVSSRTHFEKNYITAFLKSFPGIGLERRGFKLEWDDPGQVLDNVRFVMRQERPGLMERYEQFERNENISPAFVKALREEICDISDATLSAWGIRSGTQRYYPIYYRLLQDLFPALELESYEFELDWDNPRASANSIRYVFAKEMPDLIRDYYNLSAMDAEERLALRHRFYRIRCIDFDALGLTRARRHGLFPDFRAAMRAAFDDPLLGYDEAEGEAYRRSLREPHYQWRSMEEIEENLRGGFRLHRLDLLNRYNIWDSLTPEEQVHLKKDVCRLKRTLMSAWGISVAFDPIPAVPEYGGNYIDALQLLFPKLELNPLEFQLLYDSPEEAQASVDLVVRRARPDLWERYLQRAGMTEKERESLRRDIYRLKGIHLRAWGLLGAFSHRDFFPHGHRSMLQGAFPDLHLDLRGFGPDYETYDSSVESLHFAFVQGAPGLMKRYYARDPFDFDEYRDLEWAAYAISTNQLAQWGVGAARGPRVTYFKTLAGVVKAVFAQLVLDDRGFVPKWETRQDALVSVSLRLAQSEPGIFDRYQRVFALLPEELEELREDIYSLTWTMISLSGGSCWDRMLQWFEGDYRKLVMAIFNHPRLALEHVRFRKVKVKASA